MGKADPGHAFHRSDLEMVKITIILLLLIFSLTSCEIFLRTPFPTELIFWENSVPVEGTGAFHHTKLYVLGKYIFLYIDGIEDQGSQDKVYIFTKDLVQVYRDNDIYSGCDTFAMKEACNYFFVGNKRYEFMDSGSVIPHDPPFIDPYYVDPGYPRVYPPSSFGFSHDSYNYYVFWDHSNRRLVYIQYNDGWGPVITDSVTLEGYDNLAALYYHRDRDDINNCGVVLFFTRSGDNFREVEVVSFPAWYFEDPLSHHITEPDFFSKYSFGIPDVDVADYYYTGDGVVLYDHRARYVRYNMAGYRVKEYYVDRDGYSEAYSLNGRTRYLFSEKYKKLMKTGVWW